ATVEDDALALVAFADVEAVALHEADVGTVRDAQPQVLVPHVVRARETGGRAAALVHEVAQRDEARLRSPTAVQQLRRALEIEAAVADEAPVRPVRADTGLLVRRVHVAVRTRVG